MPSLSREHRGLYRLLVALIVVHLAGSALAQSSAPIAALPKGNSAWSYTCVEKIAVRVTTFNSRVKDSVRFRYFFPYAGSVGFDRDRRVAKFTYRPGLTSDPYARSLPAGVMVMPVVDGRADEKEFDGWTEEQYGAAARMVAKGIIEDPHAVGVQVDIEPFKPGHLPFYRQLREALNARGKYSTMFVGGHDEATMRAIFAACDMVVISGYDLDGENAGVAKYRKLLEGLIAGVQKVAVGSGAKYMVGIPAAASWGEFEYTVDEGGRNRVETKVTQEQYVQAALDVLKQYEGSREFVGISLWQLSSVRDGDEPEHVARRTKMPDYIRPGVWEMLERVGAAR